ncbi:MerC domain-containing protein [Bacillus cereus]|uniref:MerC domain-containing protein n=1 Tax=Lysobacter enzymogenes TaxID=69 RepID=A0AAU9AQ41_LYSEN|nr:MULTISPECIES: MerC domain-containing protein [Pseudomonadota]BAV99409.1 conserved hypothetical protein [Lysobacter enzymogenes]
MRHARCDLAALSLSGLCLAHCLALPMLAVLLPSLAAWAGAEWVHTAFVVAAVPTTSFALWRAHRARTLTAGVVALAAGGLLALALGATSAVAAHEVAVTVAGSLLLAAAHLWNWARHSHAH